jgi:Transcription elongation factor, GreA/GreB, C-term
MSERGTTGAVEGIDKREVLRRLQERVVQQLDTLTASQLSAQSGATHEETRSEHPKDTRAIEAQYLARGLADRVETLRTAVISLATLRLARFGPDDEIALTALVGVQDEAGLAAVYFLAPAGGGEHVEVDGCSVQVVTPISPVGRALVEKQVGDEAVVELPGGRRHLAIEWLA